MRQDLIKTIMLVRLSFAFFCFAYFANAYSVSLMPQNKYCVYADAVTGGQCTGSFEVISLDDPKAIAVVVHGPPNAEGNRALHFESRHVPELSGPVVPDVAYSEGSFAIDIEGSAGEYRMCIENNSESGEVQTVAFNFRTTTAEEKNFKYTGLEQELHELAEGLDLLRDHQSYMNQRERVHQEALENINAKVVFWTVLEAVVVIVMAFWQIRYISTFFETKRKM